MNLDKFRIKRTDKYNVTIQRLVGDPNKQNWVNQSYHGNSAFSLVSGLLELVMAKHTPEDAKLSEQLEKMKLDLVLGMGKLEKLIARSPNEAVDNFAQDRLAKINQLEAEK